MSNNLPQNKGELLLFSYTKVDHKDALGRRKYGMMRQY